jgi:hypothetical protein
MKALISIFIVLAIIFTGWKVVDYYQQVEQENEQKEAASGVNVSPRSLPGLPKPLENPLAEVTKKGPVALKDWLDQAKANNMVKDPRLAWIELDYVLMAVREDPVEAKRVFLSVKSRIDEDSPVYPRLKSLQKSFE